MRLSAVAISPVATTSKLSWIQNSEDINLGPSDWPCPLVLVDSDADLDTSPDVSHENLRFFHMFVDSFSSKFMFKKNHALHSGGKVGKMTPRCRSRWITERHQTFSCRLYPHASPFRL